MRMSYFNTPIGELALYCHDNRLVAIDFSDNDAGLAAEVSPDDPLLQEACHQMEAYFAGQLQGFDLPLAPSGSPFRLRVWRALQDIPYGETCSYGELAKAIGAPKASRAVGQANHHNPLSIVIPCHRVIGSDGSLTGYGGGLERKRFLLALEKRVRSCK